MDRCSTSACPTRLARPRPAVLAGATLLLGLAGALPAQEKREITVEWIFSDAGEEPTRLPRFEWTTGGDLLLLDAGRPKEGRPFERLNPTGTRSRAVDARAALAGLKELLGERGHPHLGVPCRRRGIAIHRTEVALPLH